MPRCEDYPCCGHENGACPRIAANGREVYRCSNGCGRELTGRTRTAGSSICRACTKRLLRQWSDGSELDHDYSMNG
jgi:hypothetical protein